MENLNLANFGYRELGLAGELLTALSDAKFADDTARDVFDYNDLSLECNPNSGMVYLVTENSDVLILDANGKVAIFNTCSNCGAEGTATELPLSNEGFCPAPDCIKLQTKE